MDRIAVIRRELVGKIISEEGIAGLKKHAVGKPRDVVEHDPAWKQSRIRCAEAWRKDICILQNSSWLQRGEA